jgi:hypothetical protein
VLPSRRRRLRGVVHVALTVGVRVAGGLAYRAIAVRITGRIRVGVDHRRQVRILAGVGVLGDAVDVLAAVERLGQDSALAEGVPAANQTDDQRNWIRCQRVPGLSACTVAGLLSCRRIGLAARPIPLEPSAA